MRASCTLSRPLSAARPPQRPLAVPGKSLIRHAALQSRRLAPSTGRWLAAAAAGGGGDEPAAATSSSSTSANGSQPSSSGSGSSSSSSAPDAVSMRSLPADGGSDPSTSGGSGDPSTSGRRGAAPGRLKRALMALASLRTPLTLRRLLTIAFMFSVGSLLSLASSRGRCAGPQEVLYSEFLGLVRSGNVRAARFEESSARITFDLHPHSSAAASMAPRALALAGAAADEAASAGDASAATVMVHGAGPSPRQFYTKRLAADSNLIPTLLAAGVEFGVLRQSFSATLVKVLGSALLLWIPLLPLIFVMRSFLRSAQAGSSKKRKPSSGGTSEVPVTTFADVAGMAAAKQELAEVVACLKNSSQFARLGAKMPSGVLLSGPPGTGKTLLARAVAGEAGVPFFAVSASEFVELFVGRGAARIRELFAEARKKAPCVVFIDELDAVGGKRGIGLNEERDQTLNQLLTELDGFEGRPGVLLLAATNRPDVLDAALLRPGRLSRKVTVPLPDEEARAAILGVHLRRVPLASQHDRELACEAIAKITAGFSGAELSNVVNEAAFLAARSANEAVGLQELVEAVQRTRYGVNGGGGSVGLGLQQRFRGWLVDAMSSGKQARLQPYGS
ncbi:ATP-dependent zinc metalloprotease [Micractinium conductrix]|uniref:ATP-dependent zinc metalloprotease n=1 Tax=Micractinium conductrix TaxID=554055 RepID=A0A2P6VJC5_9CHLO|nr:ATP-dependent zinc metalloprotease [Micractinium conductrix]|eukprot:PSC74189.1 ATP-dependent zinc metalloprotease [Micractinium conductrix]